MANMWRLPDEAALKTIQARLGARPIKPHHTSPKAANRLESKPSTPGIDKKGLLRALNAKVDRWPAELAQQCKLAGLPVPQVNYPFLKDQGRRFRLDCAWPGEKLVVEVDGGVHRIRDKFDRDLEKHRLLLQYGWRLLRVSPAQVNAGVALGYVERALMDC